MALLEAKLSGERPESVAAAAPAPESALAQTEPLPQETLPLASPLPPPPPSAPFSEWLAGRGLVWVGALALGLAGLFLIRYSIDNGLFGPLARVIAALGLGGGLIAGGEWLARRGPPADSAPEPSAVTSPTALIGSGVGILFTACYGAYAFYGLIGPVPAFVLLAAISFAALLMALRHGPVIALLGLVGALLVPALLAGKDDPPAFEVFLYLAAVITTGLAVVRLRGWWWLGWVALAGAVGWSLVWLSAHQGGADTLVTGGFVFLVLVLVPVCLHLADTPAPVDSEASPPSSGTPPPLMLMHATTLGAMVILFLGLRLEAYGPVALAWLGAAGGLTQWAAVRRPSLIALPWIVAATALLAYLAWLFPLPADSGWVGMVEGVPAGHMPQALIEPAFLPYTETGLAIALVFGVGGWYGVERASRTWPWALLSVSVPLLVLIIAYGHTASRSIAPPWAAAALGLGGLLLGATTALHRRIDEAPHLAIAVATYAAGVTAAVTLAMVMVLHDFWLTVAISVQLPALAWIERRTRVPEMRLIAAVLAAAVLIRLVFNPEIADYDIGTQPILNGLLYGYGLPLAAFRLAQLMVRTNSAESPGRRDGLLLGLLESGWIGFLVLLVSLQLRHLIGHGTIDSHSYGALEQGLQVTWWASLALALMHADRDGSNPILAVAWRLLAAAALAHVALFALLAWNPLWRSFSVGAWPGFNLITLNYGVPTLLAAAIALEARRRGLDMTRRLGGVAAVVLAWLFVTLSVRHLFQGPVLAGAEPGDAEWYAYSALWLAYGGGLLALGLRLDSPPLRTASLAVIVATVLKVFIFDMSTLTGLLRVASFLGLGLVLVLIGWVHQSAVKKPRTAERSSGESA